MLSFAMPAIIFPPPASTRRQLKKILIELDFFLIAGRGREPGAKSQEPEAARSEEQGPAP